MQITSSYRMHSPEVYIFIVNIRSRRFRYSGRICITISSSETYNRNKYKYNSQLHMCVARRVWFIIYSRNTYRAEHVCAAPPSISSISATTTPNGERRRVLLFITYWKWFWRILCLHSSIRKLSSVLHNPIKYGIEFRMLASAFHSQNANRRSPLQFLRTCETDWIATFKRFRSWIRHFANSLNSTTAHIQMSINRIICRH